MKEFIEIFNNSFIHVFIGINVLVFIFRPVKNTLTTLSKARASRFWKTTKGVILESNIHSYQNEEGTEMYMHHLVYSYTVKDSTYQSSGRYLDAEHAQSWKSDLQKFVQSNKPDGDIAVLYNPNDPKDSVIINAVQTRYYVVAAVAVLFAMGVFVFTVWSMYTSLQEL